MVESYHEYTGSKGSTREKVTHTEHVELPEYTTYIDASDEVPDNLFPRHAGNIRVSNDLYSRVSEGWGLTCRRDGVR